MGADADRIPIRLISESGKSTVIELPTELWERVGDEAARVGMTREDFFIDALRRWKKEAETS